MQRNHHPFRFPALRQAFTLVELLVVCAIIGILAVLTVVAVNSVAHSAKVTKTRATIQKLDTAMLQIYAGYDNKFNAIKRQIARDQPGFNIPIDRRLVAAHFIRDLMRMELPQSWEEVDRVPLPITIPGGNTLMLDDVPYTVEAPRVLHYYRQAGENAAGVPNRSALLFLIIQNLNPEALEAFHGSEVADTDGDGLLEFVDAWGRPIQFLRWAPAFNDSDIQQNVLNETAHETNRAWWLERDEDLLSAMEKATSDHPDPTDERPDRIGWFLYPLIYSAGADGVYGLDDEGTVVVGDDGILDPFMFPYGMPLGQGSGHFDNIHNHQKHR